MLKDVTGLVIMYFEQYKKNSKGSKSVASAVQYIANKINTNNKDISELESRTILHIMKTKNLKF